MKAGVEGLIRRNVRKMEAYVPIVPLEELSQCSGVPLEGVIKLDGNENPYGCSPRVRKALADYRFYHIYPDPEHKEARKAIAAYAGVSPDRVLAGAGSDELIELVVRLFLEPGEKVVNCAPTFGMYSFLTGVYGGAVTTVKRREDFSIDIEAVIEAVDPATKLIFLASPNNPTANTAGRDDVKKLLDKGLVVVIDEAYYEFSGKTLVDLAETSDRLIVLRTFSKWAGLAGLRVGYGIFPKELVPHLMKIKQPYNVNAAAQVAVLESLKDLDYLRDTVKKIVSERPRLLAELKRLPFLEVFPSEANFIFCRVTKGSARELHAGLQRKGIFIRYFDTPLLRNYIRISVGKPEHTPAVIAALKRAGEGD